MEITNRRNASWTASFSMPGLEWANANPSLLVLGLSSHYKTVSLTHRFKEPAKSFIIFLGVYQFPESSPKTRWCSIGVNTRNQFYHACQRLIITNVVCSVSKRNILMIVSHSMLISNYYLVISFLLASLNYLWRVQAEEEEIMANRWF